MSGSYSIGGRSYNGGDLSRLRHGEVQFIPQDNRKPVDNVANTIRTSENSLLKPSSGSPHKGLASSAGHAGVGAVQSSASGGGDLGGSSVSGVVTAVKGFQAVQKATPAIIKTAKGTFDVVSTAGRAVVTVANTVGVAAFVPLNPSQLGGLLKMQSEATGLIHTRTSRAIVNAVEKVKHSAARIKTGAVTAARGVKSGAAAVRNAAAASAYTVSGIVHGTIPFAAVTRNTMNAAKDAAVKGLRVTGKGALRGSVWTVKKGVPGAYRLTEKGVAGFGGALAKSNDDMVRTTGMVAQYTPQLIRTSAKAVKQTGRTVKTTVKGTIKTGRRAAHAYRFIKDKGLGAAWSSARSKAAKALYKSGRSIVSLAANVIQSIGTKFLLPLLIIIAAVGAIFSAASGGASAAAGIFGGVFTRNSSVGGVTVEEDYDILEDLIMAPDGVILLRGQYIDDMMESLTAYIDSGEVHSIRLINYDKDMGAASSIGFSREALDAAFFDEETISNIMLPILNVIFLMPPYELEVPDTDAVFWFVNLFGYIFGDQEYETTVEWCAMDAHGLPVPHHCGSVHASSDCPNVSEGIHSDYTCSYCCYKTCPGHKVECDDSCEEDCFAEHIEYCGSPCSNDCSGYYNCGSHRVLTVTFSFNGIDILLDIIFKQPIAELEAKSSLTEEEEDQLSDLYDYYEICLDYIEYLEEEFETTIKGSHVALASP